MCQDREAELDARLHSLESLNAAGDAIMKDDSTSETDAHNISSDLNTMNDRWNVVSLRPTTQTSCLLYVPGDVVAVLRGYTRMLSANYGRSLPYALGFFQ